MSTDSEKSKQRVIDEQKQPTSVLWDKYDSYRQVADKEWTNEWKASMEGVVIFAGLFSAVITAFINQGMDGLKPDPAAQAVDALQTISLQLKVLSDAVVNASTAATGPSFMNVTIPNAYVASDPVDLTFETINLLWILSLVISIICALCALLVQSWTRSYITKMAKVLNPVLRSKTRLFLRKALRKYSASGIVSAITASLHASVFLFLGGLMLAFWKAKPELGKWVLSLLILFSLVYLVSSLGFLFAHDWPFDTAISTVLKAILNQTYRVNPKDIVPNYTISALIKGLESSNGVIENSIAHDDYAEIAEAIMQKGSEDHALFYQRLVTEDPLEEEFFTLTLNQIYDSLIDLPSDGKCNQYRLGSSKIYLDTLISLLESFTIEQAREIPYFNGNADFWAELASACAPYIRAGKLVKHTAVKACLLIALILRSPVQQIKEEETQLSDAEKEARREEALRTERLHRERLNLLTSNLDYAWSARLPSRSSSNGFPSPPEKSEDGNASPEQTSTVVSSSPSTSTRAIKLPLPQVSAEPSPCIQSTELPEIYPYDLLFSSCGYKGALPVLKVLEEAVRNCRCRPTSGSPTRKPRAEAVALTILNILNLPVDTRTDDEHARTPGIMDELFGLISNTRKEPIQVDKLAEASEPMGDVLDAISHILPYLTACNHSTKVDISQALANRSQQHPESRQGMELQEQWNRMNSHGGVAQVLVTSLPTTASLSPTNSSPGQLASLLLNQSNLSSPSNPGQLLGLEEIPVTSLLSTAEAAPSVAQVD